MRAIYKITNTVNNKVYIGESMDIERRWLEHKEDLLKGTHHSYKLQSDYNLYGKDSFEYNVEEEFPMDTDSYKCMCYLIYREDYYIKKYNSVEEGYNCEYTLSKVLNKEKSLSDNINFDVNMLKLIMFQGEGFCLYKKGDPKYVEFKFDYSSVYNNVLYLFESYISSFQGQDYMSKIFNEFELFSPSKCYNILKKFNIIDNNNFILIKDIGFYNEDCKSGKPRVMADKNGLIYLLNCLKERKEIGLINKKIDFTNFNLD